MLDERKITHILTCASTIGPRFPKDYEYKVLELLDKPDENITAHFESAQAFINSCREKKGRVLVHCFAGKSRASTITLSYMMSEMRVMLKESYEHLKERRPIAQPNIGFVLQLMGLEKRLFGQNSSIERMKQEAMAAKKEEESSEQKELADAAQIMLQQAEKKQKAAATEEKKE